MASSNSHRPSDKFVILGFLNFSSLLTWIKFVIKPCMHLVIIHLIWGLLRLGKESWNQTLRFWYLCTKYDNCHSSGRKTSVIFVQLTGQLFASLNEQFHTWFCIVDEWRYYIYHFNSRENMQSCSLANAIQGTCSILSRWLFQYLSCFTEVYLGCGVKKTSSCFFLEMIQMENNDVLFLCNNSNCFCFGSV